MHADMQRSPRPFNSIFLLSCTIYLYLQLELDLYQCCFSTTCYHAGCVRIACPASLLATCYNVIDSTDLLQVVPTICYRPAIQQLVNKLSRE